MIKNKRQCSNGHCLFFIDVKNKVYLKFLSKIPFFYI